MSLSAPLNGVETLGGRNWRADKILASVWSHSSILSQSQIIWAAVLANRTPPQDFTSRGCWHLRGFSHVYKYRPVYEENQNV